MTEHRWSERRIGHINEMNNASQDINPQHKFKKRRIGHINDIPKYDSWPELIGKSALKGFTSLADLPRLIGEGVEGTVNLARRTELEDAPNSYIPYRFKTNPETPQTDYSRFIPSTEDVRSGIKKYAGIDLEPRPETAAQRVFSHGAEFAGGMGLFGGATKAANLARKGINAAKAAGSGAVIGTTSGALQEGGMNPLVADIGTALTLPLASAGTKNLLNKFSPSHRNILNEQKVANALKTRIGEENIPTVLENIQQYKRQKKPINLQPTTPELAQDVGLSQLYRTQSDLGSIPAQYAKNDVKLREALTNLGTTGLEESAKGEALRQPFIKRFAKKKERRSKLVEPLYKELEDIQTGINPVAARDLLTKELEVASPGNQAQLNKYLKSLNRNGISEAELKRIKDLRTELKNIDVTYKDLSPNAIAQLKAPLQQELAEVESLLYPRPIQIENTIQELGDKVNALSRTGESNAARRFGGIKKAYEEDLAKTPVGLKHRTEYARLSKPINEIETSNLLNAFVKENKDINKLEGLLAPSEKIPELVLKADLPNTKILMNKSKSNPETMKLIKGIYIDELLKKSTLSSGNLSFDKANKFLNDKFMKEKVNVIFNTKERHTLNQFLDTLEKRTKVETMGKVSGSDTHQKLKIDEAFNNSLTGLGKIIGHSALKASGVGKAGESLFNTSKDLIKQIKDGRYNNILENALIDPNYFKKLITQKRTPKSFKDFYKPVPSIATAGLLNLKD
jgi:hypothetical protein